MPPETTIDGWFHDSEQSEELAEDERAEILLTLKDQLDWVRAHFEYRAEMRRQVQQLIN